MKNIQSLVVILFSILFYVVGAVYFADKFTIINIIFFNIFLYLSFRIKLTNLYIRVKKDLTIKTGEVLYKRILKVLIFIICIFFIYIYTPFGIPILANNVEEARVILVDRFGVIYRIGTQIIFYAPPIVLYGIFNKIISKKTLVIIYIIGAILLLSMGFRSRILDYFIITVLSWVVLNKVYFNYYVKNIKSFFFSNFALLIIGISLIVYLTALRTGLNNIELLLSSVLHRVFLLNYEVNIERVFTYVKFEGFLYGKTFLTDILSIVSDEYNSMQVLVTQYFNKINSDLMVMTPTVYGEFYLNFGTLGLLFVFPIVVVYRFLFESFLTFSFRIKQSRLIIFATIINYLYYVPRVVATGGVSNSFLIKGLSILIGFCFVLLTITLFDLLPKKNTLVKK